MKYGYVRVSTAGQKRDGNSIEAQEKALKEAGAEVVYKEAFTGTAKHRPQFDKLLKELKSGDTLIVTKLDRIARSVLNGCEIIDGLLNQGVCVYVLNMGMINNSASGKLIRNIMLSFAEFERDMICERTAEGKAIAKANNPDYKEGRKSKDFDISVYLPRIERKEITISEVCEVEGISRSTWCRRFCEYQKSIS